MAITLDQKSVLQGDALGGTSLTNLTWGTPPTAGSTVVIVFSVYKDPGEVTFSVTDNRGNSYTVLHGDTGDIAKVAVAYATNVTTGASFINSCTCSVGSNYVQWGGASFLNVPPFNAYDTGSGTGTAPAASLSTPGSDALLIGVAAVSNTTTYTPPTGTVLFTENSMSVCTHQSTFRVVSASGAQTMTWGVTPSDTWRTIMVAFSAAAPGGLLPIILAHGVHL